LRSFRLRVALSVAHAVCHTVADRGQTVTTDPPAMVDFAESPDQRVERIRMLRATQPGNPVRNTTGTTRLGPSSNVPSRMDPSMVT
jgi:hypothetical protein